MPKPSIDFYRFAFEYANEVHTEQLGDTANRIARALNLSRLDQTMTFADALDYAKNMQADLTTEPTSSTEHAKEISQILLRYFSIEDSVTMRDRFDEALKDHIPLFELSEWNKVYVTSMQVAEVRYESHYISCNDCEYIPWLSLNRFLRVDNAVAMAKERIIYHRNQMEAI